MGAERPLHRDAFRRVVVRELCRDNGAGRVALLDPSDSCGDQIVIWIKHRWIGLTGIEIARADALSLAYSSCELKSLKDAHKAPLPLHFALPHGCDRQSETTNAGH